MAKARFVTESSNETMDVSQHRRPNSQDPLGHAQPDNDTRGAPRDLVAMFVDNAVHHGSVTAVETDERQLTYAELDRLSNQLAHRLLSLGVTRESRVGISLPRGAGELLAMLSTLKASAAYVPLDPGNPIERLHNIIEDAAPHVMIVHPSSPLAASASDSGRVIVLDDLDEATRDYPTAAPDVTVLPEQLAYILFTSGSTGRPKGVEIPRGAFANFLRSMAHTPGMTRDDRLLAITTTSFDIAGLELFLPLWVGATVIIADRETARDPRLLLRKLAACRANILQATPATWRLLLEAGFSGYDQLRMLCGGEALSPELAQRLLRAGGELWNMYGPTETTVWSTLKRITSTERITIGVPIDDTQVYVLDEALGPVPVGGEGELWIGGAGVARGYHGRPELTAERFVQNPRGPAGDRIYRTGDLGRALPNGELMCLGRLDHQVKIRGFRIELGEIESALRTVSGVDEALVVADQREGEDDPRLLAYWVGPAPRVALMEAAKLRLPAYMVPSAYVSLPAFPLNTNGKIDRKQLPRPETLNQLAAAPLAFPRTDSESRIAAIWRDVLRLPVVGVDQDFFVLGGNSALAVQVVARLGEEIGVDFSLALFFEEPTVRGIAARLDRVYSPDDPIVVWLRKGPVERPPLWCLFGVAIYQELAHVLPGDRAVVGVHVPFRYLHELERQPTIHEVARRYIEVLRAHQPHGPYYLLGLCFGGIVAHEVARLLEQSGQVVGLVTVLDAVLPTGMQVDQVRRLKSYLGKVRRDPREMRRWLQNGRHKLASRVVKMRSRFSLPPDPTRLDPKLAPIPEELPVDGPEIDDAVERFSVRPRRLASPLLIVRATHAPLPPWVTVDADLGWHRLTSRVIVLDVPAGHLEILREPHVRELGAAIAGEIDGVVQPAGGL
jgi:amino acid adenylation domain-containing protein